MCAEKKGLTRSTSDKVFAGVLAGIAEHYGLNVTWLRIGVIFISLFTFGTTVAAYLVSMVIIPKDRN